MSVTFIPSTLDDNPALTAIDPKYRAGLRALQKIDRLRLEDGNWNVRPAAGMFFERGWFKIVDAAPVGVREIRYWDRAATDAESKNANTASHTAGVKMRQTKQGEFYITHVDRFQGTPGKVQARIMNIASQDGRDVEIGIEGDPAQAGKAEAELQIKNLAGFKARVNTVHESKGTRAKPLSAYAEAGLVFLLRGEWNEDFIKECVNFDGTKSCVADQVDAASGGFHMLTKPRKKAGMR